MTEKGKQKRVFKKYQDWCCIFLEWNEQRIFYSDILQIICDILKWVLRYQWYGMILDLTYKFCSENIKTEALFTKKEMNNQCNIHFRQNTALSLLDRLFANGLGDWCSIPGWVILKMQKWYLMPSCLIFSIIR